MNELTRNGKATAWGTSMWSAQQITEGEFRTQDCSSFDPPVHFNFHRCLADTLRLAVSPPPLCPTLPPCLAAYWIAQTRGLEPPSFEQPQYNMVTREKVEAECVPPTASRRLYPTHHPKCRATGRALAAPTTTVRRAFAHPHPNRAPGSLRSTSLRTTSALLPGLRSRAVCLRASTTRAPPRARASRRAATRPSTTLRRGARAASSTR